jgi:dTDP-4-amino-4,6-dideoxygalactose transaminase
MLVRVPLLDLGAEIRSLRAEIDAALRRVLDSCAFIGGPEVAAFESDLAAFLGARHVVAVANGTDALEIALQAAGIGAGDNVAVPAFTFAATVEAVVRVGARPLLIDVDATDLCIDIASLAAALQRHAVRAVLPVHLYGQPADMESLLAVAGAHGALVIEDAAQAHGAVCAGGRRAGTLGRAGCFSFYPTKNLGALGDGGALCTDDDGLAATARLIANHGEAAKYEHVRPDGRNSRLDALQAAVLRVKLPHVDTWNERRRALAHRYDEALADLPLRLPAERSGTRCVFHQYTVRTPRRDEVAASLRARGIATGIHYPRALHQQPGFRFPAAGGLGVATAAAREVLCLPMSPHLPAGAVDEVAAALRAALRP